MESSVAFPCSSSSVAPGLSSSTLKHFYCMVNNIPDSFHTSDLRNFFSEYIDGEKFDMFHFRHRPQVVNVENERKSESGAGNSRTETSQKATLKRFCCPVRFNEESTREKFIRRYHKKLWMDKEGNDLPVRCIITKVSLNTEDLQKFANKELHPPKFMPRGNVGTPNAHFLNLIRECRLPPSLIKKLELEFPRARKFKRYSKVPPPPILNKEAKVVLPENENDDDVEEIKTAKGHSISDVFIPKSSKEHSSGLNSSEGQEESDKESNADDDDDRCEEWERHEALHDHRTTHGDMTSESKERLYEEEIELQWEKGGPGIVWYTDALYWDQQRGSFDERTSDDWDVDVEGYYEPGGGDKDAHDLMDMRRSERVQQGLETISVVKKTAAPKMGHSSKIRVQLGGSTTDDGGMIGQFEKYTRGVGRKVMEKFGWKDGEGLGKTIQGIPDALENEGQAPADKRGFGYYGEKLDLGNPTKRRREFKDYDIEANDRIIIGTIYDKPEDLDIPEPLARRNAPTFIKRYDFCKASSTSEEGTSKIVYKK